MHKPQKAPGRADVVIAGAGIAGISTAFHLAVRLGVERVVICDPLPPMTLTSDKSTECYRNWWPGPGDAMVALMNRSIDLLEEWAISSHNVFNLSRRGYLYVTGDPVKLAAMEQQAGGISAHGGGDLRVHRGRPEDPPYAASPPAGFEEVPGGADLFLDGRALRSHFPYLSPAAVGGLHVRRAGWFSAQQLGVWLLGRARAAGVGLVADRVVALDISNGRTSGVRLASGEMIETDRFLNAAGPLAADVGRLAGADLPLFSEVHRKVSFRDVRSALPRHAPLLIWNDPQTLAWSKAEQAELAEDPDRRYLVGLLGAGAHCRPEGPAEAATVLGLWECHTDVRLPEFPIADDPLYPEIVLRGLTTMVPGFGEYLERLPQPYVDGGYYTKTAENRPLIGPAGVAGSFVVAALSGFGIMAAAAAGELGALHVVGGALPDYWRWFSPDRYADPGYLTLVDKMTDSGQI